MQAQPPSCIHSASVILILQTSYPQISLKFCEAHRQFNSVFDTEIEENNCAYQQFQAKVNVGPVELSQRKGR